MTTIQYFGLVDVHLIRRMYLHECDYQNALDTNNFCNGAGEIQMLVDELIADLNEIAKTRVYALGGNCIVGYRVDINAFEQFDERRQVYLMITHYY